MPWPAGALRAVARELSAALGGVSELAGRIGGGLANLQSVLSDPLAPIDFQVAMGIETEYQIAEPTAREVAKGGLLYESPLFLDSQLSDLMPPRGTTGFFLVYQTEVSPEYPRGRAASGWRNFSDYSIDTFMEERNITAGDLISVTFGRRTGP